MCFAYNVVLLLSPCDGRMAYDDFIVEYQRRAGSTHLLYPTDYGLPTMPRLFDAIQLVAQVRGRRNFKMIILNPEFRRMLLKYFDSEKNSHASFLVGGYSQSTNFTSSMTPF